MALGSVTSTASGARSGMPPGAGIEGGAPSGPNSSAKARTGARACVRIVRAAANAADRSKAGGNGTRVNSCEKHYVFESIDPTAAAVKSRNRSPRKFRYLRDSVAILRQIGRAHV